MENFQPELPRRVELWENVLTALRTAILRGELPRGTRLVEAELSDKLGVSRGPVREALTRLEQEGLVEGLPRRGTAVVGLSDQDVSEVFSMRILLEGYGARMAAERATDEDIQGLQARLDEMASMSSRGESRGIGDRDIEFHRAILGAARNRRLLTAWEPLAGTARTMLVLTEEANQDYKSTINQHQQIVDAIRRHDPREAEELMRWHMTGAEKNMLAIKNGGQASDVATPANSLRAR